MRIIANGGPVIALNDCAGSVRMEACTIHATTFLDPAFSFPDVNGYPAFEAKHCGALVASIATVSAATSATVLRQGL